MYTYIVNICWKTKKVEKKFFVISFSTKDVNLKVFIFQFFLLLTTNHKTNSFSALFLFYIIFVRTSKNYRSLLMYHMVFYSFRKFSYFITPLNTKKKKTNWFILSMKSLTFKVFLPPFPFTLQEALAKAEASFHSLVDLSFSSLHIKVTNSFYWSMSMQFKSICMCFI